MFVIIIFTFNATTNHITIYILPLYLHFLTFCYETASSFLHAWCGNRETHLQRRDLVRNARFGLLCVMRKTRLEKKMLTRRIAMHFERDVKHIELERGYRLEVSGWQCILSYGKDRFGKKRVLG